MQFNRLDAVFTKDDHFLGTASSLYHRTDDVRPGWQHYATYMLVQSLTLGNSFYVPIDFVAGRDPESGQIRLTVTARRVESNTWSHQPDFILHGEARREVLETGQQDAVEAAANHGAAFALPEDRSNERGTELHMREQTEEKNNEQRTE